MVHLMVDHFTYFAVTGESAANKQAPKDVLVLAYVTPPEVDGDCVVRVYCVGGTPAAVEVCEPVYKNSNMKIIINIDTIIDANAAIPLLKSMT